MGQHHLSENRPIREKESQNRNLMQLSEQSLEEISVFKEASINVIFISLFNKAGKDFNNH
jgi:hypothetical protein